LTKIIKKDKKKAKIVVLKNLKKDPQFYTNLKHLNIDEPALTANITKNKKEENIKNTKLILNQMIEDNRNRKIQQNNPNAELVDVIKNMSKEKIKRKSWLF
jgi:hypothetical protein